MKFIVSELIIVGIMLIFNSTKVSVNDYYSFIDISYGIVFIFSGTCAYFLMNKEPPSPKWKITYSSFLGRYLLLFFFNMWLVPLIILKHLQDYSEIIDGVYAYKSVPFQGLVPYTYALGLAILLCLLLCYASLRLAERVG